MQIPIRAHAISTVGYNEDKYGALKHIPMDHVFLSSEDGRHGWGCFGRGLADDVPDARIITRVPMSLEWVDGIMDQDGGAGVVNQVTGVCHHCANRALIMAGEDVSAARGNEIAVLMFGLYGLNMSDYIQRVKNVISDINKRLFRCGLFLSVTARAPALDARDGHRSQPFACAKC